MPGYFPDEDDDDFARNLLSRQPTTIRAGSRAAYQPQDFSPEGGTVDDPESFGGPSQGREISDSDPSDEDPLVFPRVYSTLEGGRTGYMPRPTESMDDPESLPYEDSMPKEGEGYEEYMRRLAPPKPDIQGSWDKITDDMDRFQRHLRSGPDVPPDETTAHSVPHGYFPGGMGVPPLITGSDNKTYLADNEGKPIYMNGQPVTFDQFYQSQRSAQPVGDDYDRQVQRHLHNEAAAWNSSLARNGYPEAGQEFAGLIDQRSQFLQGLMQQVQQDPNLSSRARANALSHLYGQMGQLSTHWDRAQQQSRQKALSSGLHPDYGTPEGPELSPRQQQDVQDTEQALRGIMADNSLSMDQKVQAGTMLSQKLSQLDPLRRYRNGSQPMRQVDKWMAQNYHVDPETGNTTYFDGKVWKVVPPKPQGKAAAGSGKETWEGMPLDKKWGIISKHAIDHGISIPQARQEIEQEMQAMGHAGGTADITHPAGQDHPNLQGYLHGRLPLDPTMRNMSPETRRQLQHVVSAGDSYGWTMQKDENGENHMVPDPISKGYQQRAAALLGAQQSTLGQPQQQRMTPAQKEAHGKKVEAAMKTYGLEPSEAELFVRGGSPHGQLYEIKTEEEWGKMWQAAEDHVDKQLHAEDSAEAAHEKAEQQRKDKLGSAYERGPDYVRKKNWADRDRMILDYMNKRGLLGNEPTYESYRQGKINHNSNQTAGFRRQMEIDQQRALRPAPPVQPSSAPKGGMAPPRSVTPGMDRPLNDLRGPPPDEGANRPRMDPATKAWIDQEVNRQTANPLPQKDHMSEDWFKRMDERIGVVPEHLAGRDPVVAEALKSRQALNTVKTIMLTNRDKAGQPNIMVAEPMQRKFFIDALKQLRKVDKTLPDVSYESVGIRPDGTPLGSGQFQGGK